MIYAYKFFSSTYGTDVYGTSTYQETAGTSTGGNAGGAPLANTGYDIIIPVSLGISILVASAILLVRRARRSRSQA